MSKPSFTPVIAIHGGAGTIADPARTAIQLNKYVKEAPFADPEQSPFMSEIHVLKDDPDFEL